MSKDVVKSVEEILLGKAIRSVEAGPKESRTIVGVVQVGPHVSRKMACSSIAGLHIAQGLENTVFLLTHTHTHTLNHPPQPSPHIHTINDTCKKQITS